MSREVSPFILTHIENVGHLEALLLLYHSPLRIWDVAEITREVRGNQHAIERWIKSLVACGLASTNGGRYQFRPTSDELKRQVEALAKIYRARPAWVIERMHSKPAPS